MPTTTGPLRALRPRAVTVAVGVLVAGLLAGCGGGSSDEPEDASTSSASPSSSSSESSASPAESPSAESASDEESEAAEEELPLPEAPKARNTPDGRKAFTEFVVERWGYALTTNDASALSDLSAKGKTCQGCKELATELAKRKKQGWNVDFPGAEVKKVTVKPAGAPATFEATAVIDIPASQSFFEDGTYRNDNKAFKNAEFIVQMTFTKARYTLGSFRVA